MKTECDVIMEHTELILAIGIERIVTGRNAALAKIEKILEQIDAISQLTAEIGGGTVKDWAMKMENCYGCWLMETSDQAIPEIIRNIDRNIWHDLMLKSGLMALMDTQARVIWRKSLEENNFPFISKESILTTFDKLQSNKMDFFERGVINVFRGLSWDYKTNSPCRFGKKIILKNLVAHNDWGFSLNGDWHKKQLADLEKMLLLLDGKPAPNDGRDISIRLMEHVRDHPMMGFYEDELFSIQYFKKGTAHLTFKKIELIAKMNNIIAKYYPGMLAPRQ
ncbi:DUF4942 domain-containing protein [Erwinia sp. S38]|uniref:DUF4942 domain-containing protein n=1 Tax=Erwinia sp. S38 TaxID=2769338 RepID=UPI00190C5BD7|nr:DUF4942 domain-containing protein [Erwinia sp. S38]MBK0003510.1 DUF4942 domain-containing protein [Erwinia sp. S38]